MMTGGLSDTQPATPEIQRIANEMSEISFRVTFTAVAFLSSDAYNYSKPLVKPQFESKENRTYGIFKAIKYRSQVVAGVNYFIKVQVSDTDYVHLRVFEALPCENQGLKLDGFQTGKTRDDPIDYF